MIPHHGVHPSTLGFEINIVVIIVVVITFSIGLLNKKSMDILFFLALTFYYPAWIFGIQLGDHPRDFLPNLTLKNTMQFWTNSICIPIILTSAVFNTFFSNLQFTETLSYLKIPSKGLSSLKARQKK